MVDSSVYVCTLYRETDPLLHVVLRDELVSVQESAQARVVVEEEESKEVECRGSPSTIPGEGEAEESGSHGTHAVMRTGALVKSGAARERVFRAQTHVHFNTVAGRQPIQFKSIHITQQSPLMNTITAQRMDYQHICAYTCTCTAHRDTQIHMKGP